MKYFPMLIGVKFLSALLATVSQDIAQERNAPAPGLCLALGSICSLSSHGDVQALTFETHLNGLNVTGETSITNATVDTSFTVHIDDKPEIFFTGSFVNGIYTATYKYGSNLDGVHNLTLTTQDGKRIEGTANNITLRPFTGAVAQFLFANGSTVPSPRFPEALILDLQQLPDIARVAVRQCKSAQSAPVQQRDSPALALRQLQNPFEIPPRFDDTSHAAKCVVCLAEATAASIGCGLACGFSFGLACACVAAIPIAYTNCHNPGTGFTQGCCPVACGPISEVLGISTVSQCCFAEDSCVSTDNGRCCASGLQPCGGRTCCPSNAPCRDPGICCPANRNVCITGSGPACCNEGEDCIQGVCCPRASIVNGQCCLPSSQTCCPSGTPSRCGTDSIQHCVNNRWVSSPCLPPQQCIGIPVAGAGVACECPPPRPGAPFCCNPQDPGCCYAGTPSRCGHNSIQRCVNNRWVDEPCLPPKFCLSIPFAGAGVSCSGVGGRG